MKTVFKVGMKVYDYAYGKGEVIEVQNYKFLDNTLLVKFESREAPIKYSLDGRLINYKSCGGDLAPENVATNPTLSISPYKLEGFEQKAPAITYDSVRLESLKKGEYVSILNGIELPDERTSKAFEALAKLIWLRDYYNEGWQPDWTKATVKYCIEVYGEDLSIIDFQFKLKPMAFKTREIRDKFLEEQKELLEIAKPLL